MLPTKFRLHVTPRDCALGCTIEATRASWRTCALARPAIRFFNKFDAESVSVMNDYLTVWDGNAIYRYVPTDPGRMNRFTTDNDRQIMQKPTSFTFVLQKRNVTLPLS